MDRKSPGRQFARQQRLGHETPPFDLADNLSRSLESESHIDREKEVLSNRQVTPPAEADLFPVTQTLANSHILSGEVSHWNDNPTNITPSSSGENEVVDSVLQNIGVTLPTLAPRSTPIENDLREIEEHFAELNPAYDPVVSRLVALPREVPQPHHQHAVHDLQRLQKSEQSGHLGQHMLEQREQLDTITSPPHRLVAHNVMDNSCPDNHQQQAIQYRQQIAARFEELLPLLEAEGRKCTQQQHQQRQEPQPQRRQGQQQQQFKQLQEQLLNESLSLPPLPLTPNNSTQVYNSTLNAMNRVDRSLWSNNSFLKLPPPAPGTLFAPRDTWFTRKSETAGPHADIVLSQPRDRGLSQPQSQNLSQSKMLGLEQHDQNPRQPKAKAFETNSLLGLNSQAPGRGVTVSHPPPCESGQSTSRGLPSPELADFSKSWPPTGCRSSHVRTDSLPSRVPRTGFKPMHAVTNTRSARDLLPTNSSKFSINYAGVHNNANASCDELPEHLNAAVWLTNLPPDISFHELLFAIRGHGRVWCSYINQPDFVKHTTAAAKIVFFEHTAAHRLLKTCWGTSEGLSIRGHNVRIDHNRIKNPSVKEYTSESRCLIITGESWFVNEHSLTQRFMQKFVFQLDEVIELYKSNGRTVMEYRFGSWRNQAQMGKMSLEKDRPPGFEKAEYGQDPCETGMDCASYDIAALRVRGIGL